ELGALRIGLGWVELETDRDHRSAASGRMWEAYRYIEIDEKSVAVRGRGRVPYVRPFRPSITACARTSSSWGVARLRHATCANPSTGAGHASFPSPLPLFLRPACGRYCTHHRGGPS